MRVTDEIAMIPLDRVTVLNPRERNRKLFQDLVSSIAHLGLKKPVSVRRRPDGDGERYELICGQGRLEAFRHLGQTHIPALIVEAEESDCLVMSLAENMARRTPTPLEHVRAIGDLKAREYSVAEIARKTDLGEHWVRDICVLLERGEERLLTAVEGGRIPISIAVEIAKSDEAQLRTALTEAYERNQITGSQITTVQKIIGVRTEFGKDYARHRLQKKPQPVNADGLLRAFRKEADRQRLLVKKAELAQTRLTFIVSALKKLLADEHFSTLLRAENIPTLPLYLAQRLGFAGDGAR